MKPTFEVYPTLAGDRFYWRLRAPNHQIIARSESSYSRRRDVHRALEQTWEYIFDAEVRDIGKQVEMSESEEGSYSSALHATERVNGYHAQP